MNLTRTMKIIVAAVATVLTTACGGSEPLVDPTIMLAYGMDSNEANTENLMKSYGSAINKSRKSGIKEPGIYSDYAVTLVKAGRRAEANNWFNKEMEAFPSSRGYVLKLKKELIPEYANDNSIRGDEAIMDTISSLPPATRAAAEERAAEIMEGSNTETDNIGTEPTELHPEETENEPESSKEKEGESL